MTQNPNAPLFDEAISFPNGPNNTAPFNMWCSVIGRTEGQWSSTRGRQYEIDQVQTGTVQSTLRNDDGVLDPSNSAGPFYPQITPYRGYRRRAQLPATINLLTADQATASKASLGLITSSTLPQWVLAGFYGTTIGNNGTFNFYTTGLPANPTQQVLITLTGFSVAPSTAYAAQCQANGTAGLSVELVISWYNAAGTLISSVAGTPVALSGTAATLSVTGTAPANAAGALIYIANTTNPVGATTVNSWNCQVEQNTSISTWVQPGTWYDMFTGFVERWPQRWTDGGTYGLTDLTSVDAFGYLSQRRILSPAYMEILALGPTWFYPLDEASGAVQGYDLRGTRSPATIVSVGLAIAGLGFQTVTFGSSLPTVTGGQSASGVAGPCVTAGTNTVSFNQLVDVTAGGANPAGPQATSWTRIIAFKVPTQASMASQGQIPLLGITANFGASNEADILLQANYDAAGKYGNGAGNGPVVGFVNAGVVLGYLSIGGNTATTNYNLSDGGWHVAIFGISGGTPFGWIDAQAMTYQVSHAGTQPSASSFLGGQDILTGRWSPSISGGNVTPGPLDASYSCYAEVPYALTSAQVAEVYSAFTHAGSGSGVASSGTRAADVLRWAQWAGQSAIDTFATGETQTYGPSVDLNATANQPGTDGVSALQTVTDSEDGEQFVNKSGAVTFFARQRRMNKATPKVTFGENTAGGEIPYTDCSFGLDPARLANDSAITQTMTGTATRVLNQTSVNTYGDVQLQRNVNDTTQLGINDMATRLANHFATPVQRLETLTVEPGTFTIAGSPSTNAWAACLSLELGDLVTINRRPPNAPLLSFSGFVEQIRWKIDDAGNATFDLQVSPNYGNQYWALGDATYGLLGSTTILGY